MYKFFIFFSKIVSSLALILLLSRCSEPVKRNHPEKHKTVTAKSEKPEKSATPVIQKPISYHLASGKQWFKTVGKTIDSVQLHVVLSVNRTDLENLPKIDSILIPDDLTQPLASYLPFPASLAFLKEVDKIIFFSYPTQTFGAYQKGQLVYTGPTNMGRKKDPTPLGIFYTNWKAEETISTVDDEWKLRWNFNIKNKEGVGWHQYNLPGYPASHSCLRLQEADAKYLYSWADQWKVTSVAGRDSVIAQGTPVVVFGKYQFGSPKPWLQLVHEPNALNITEATLQQSIATHLNDILAQQQRRETATTVIAKN